MMNSVFDIKKEQMVEIYDFYEFIKEYGYIYHFPNEMLDSPFKKIIEGIEEVRKLIDDSWDI